MSDITIRHTHADGTILIGSSKGDGVYEIVKQHGFTWRRVPGIFIRGSRDKDAHDWKINAAAEALRAAGHTVTVDIDNSWRPTAEREADREQRADARAERYNERAAAAARRSEAARETAEQIAGRRPFGQPILIGHHSQRMAERDQERINSATRKEMAEGDKARELAHRSVAAERNLEHRVDPRVTMRRIERLEADLRGWQRRSGQRAEREVTRISEEIAHWRAHLDKLAASGEFVPWGPEHFRKGDQVNVRGRWCTVRRVNRKSVSVPWIVGTMTTGQDSEHSDTIPWDDISGRRRDGWQLDTPNGEPWPVAEAVRVARWRELLHRASLPSTRYDDETRYVGYARRIVHGLPITASEAELRAFPQPDDVKARRARALAYLAVYERLAAGEPVSDVAVTTEPIGDAAPVWRMPDGPTVDRRIDQLCPGDVVKGFYDHGCGSNLVRAFCGPVVSVSEPVDRGEWGTFRTVTLSGGTGEDVSRRFKTHVWFAVHPAGAGSVAGDSPAAAGEAATQAEPVDPWADLIDLFA